ncbi:hypothetical protein [Saccharibacillus endophyticus]|uniref:Uncharacterized protein n=1 Tax=Saccharibacillus endophyticus TaxID=2060666 RepID=A0ABQ1ZS95_9BACL|nr:hypothetical protein [Saccharibacillus endophyticus]GGH76577.1 hypothetical protein GCM10007362_19030 [Saccharibacillus endophyticus]
MPNRNKNKWMVVLAAGLLLISAWSWSNEAASLAVQVPSSPSSVLTFND